VRLVSYSLRIAMVSGMALGGIALGNVMSTAGATTTLMTCSLKDSVASLNPPLVSGTAKYFKAAAKEDAVTPGSGTDVCTVDAGIRTDNTATDNAGKDNPFDNQSFGQSPLHVIKQASSSAGVQSCSSQDANFNNQLYPHTYPVNGKETLQYNEVNPTTLAHLSTQFYFRLKAPDPVNSPTLVNLHGIVIKGVGIGGDADTSFNYSPQSGDTKSQNLLDCVAATGTTASNAALFKLHITPASSLTVTLP